MALTMDGEFVTVTLKRAIQLDVRDVIQERQRQVKTRSLSGLWGVRNANGRTFLAYRVYDGDFGIEVGKVKDGLPWSTSNYDHAHRDPLILWLNDSVIDAEVPFTAWVK